MSENDSTENAVPAVEVQETAVVEEPIVAEVKEPEPAPAPKPKSTTTTAVATHVVSGNDKDDVFLKQAVFKNPRARKSLTIHHLQRRLAELGYGDAAADRDGWYGDLTKLAVEAWQKDNRIEPTGLMNAKTIEGIFAGDSNVRVNVD